MHFYSPRAAAARGIKTLDEQARNLYGAVGVGPDLTPRPLRAGEQSAATGLLSIATNLIAGMRAKQNFNAERERKSLTDEYTRARLLEINAKLHPQTMPVEVGGRTFNLAPKDAASLTAQTQPKAATGNGRLLGPDEVTQVNRQLPAKYQLDPKAQNTVLSAQTALASTWRERDDARASSAASRSGRASTLRAELDDLDAREKSDAQRLLAPSKQNVVDWTGTYAAGHAKGATKKQKAAAAEAYPRFASQDTYLSMKSDSVKAYLAPRYANARAQAIRRAGGEAPEVVAPAPSWEEQMEKAAKWLEGGD